jgi:hypothetical protein
VTQALWVAAHLAGWAVLLLAASGVGRALVSRVPFAHGAERLAFSLAAGLGAWALFLFALGLTGTLYRPVVLVLTLLAAAAHAVFLWRRRGRLADWRTWVEGRRRYLPIALFAAACWGLLFYATLYPPLAWDAVAHHFVLARNALAAHRIVPDTGLPYPLLLFLNHALFAWGMAVQDDVLAMLIGHTFLVMTALALYAWGKRRNQPALGIAAGAFWVAQPFLIWLGQSGYVDLGIAAFVFLGVYALRVFHDEGQRAWWYLALAMFAFAAGVKLPGLLALGLAMAFGFWRFVRSRFLRPADQHAPDSAAAGAFGLADLAAGGLFGLALAAPWYGLIAYHTGDPFWPVMPRLALKAWAPPAVFSAFEGGLYSSAGAPKTLVDFLRVPYDWVYRSSRFQAEAETALHPLIAAWPLAWLVALRDRSVRWWTAGALAWILFWFFAMPHVLRYVVPALPLVILALFESIRWTLTALRLSPAFQRGAWATLAALFLFSPLRDTALRIRQLGPPPADAAGRDRFFTSFSAAYPGARYINTHAAPGDLAWVINASWLNYRLNIPVIDSISMLVRDHWPTYRWPEDAPWQAYIESRGVAWILVDHGDPGGYLPPPPLPPGKTFWPDYSLAYSDDHAWVFHRERR